MNLRERIATAIDRYEAECLAGIRAAEAARQTLESLDLTEIPATHIVFMHGPNPISKHPRIFVGYHHQPAYDVAAALTQRHGLVFQRRLDERNGDIEYRAEINGIEIVVFSASDPTCKIVRREVDRKEYHYELECPNAPIDADEVPA